MLSEQAQHFLDTAFKLALTDEFMGGPTGAERQRIEAIRAEFAALNTTPAAPPVADDVALPVNEYQIEGGYGPKDWHSITLKRQPQRQGSDKWAVYRNSSVLSKDGDWEYEPLPSSRDDDFLARCRFDTPQEALAFYEKCRLDAQRRP